MHVCDTFIMVDDKVLASMKAISDNPENAQAIIEELMKTAKPIYVN